LTVFALNKSNRPEKARIVLEGLTQPCTLHTYQVTEPTITQPGYRMKILRTAELGASNAEMADTLPPQSITAYTTFKLSAGDPGVIGE
jgi:hypothetical protein